MKKKRFIAAFCAAVMLASSANAANIADFPDAQNHWAYNYLSNAVKDGYLNGADGKLMPDSSLTTAQMATILNRILHTKNSDRKYPNISQDQWYSNDANLAVSAGFLPYDGSLSINSPVTRGDVFKALADAFGISQANPPTYTLQQFKDWTDMNPAQRRAAAVLFDAGLIKGYENGGLNALKSISRAEFVTLVYRIMGEEFMKIYAPWQEQNAEQQVSTETPVHMLIDMPDLTSLSSDVTYKNVVIKGNVPAFYENSAIKTDRFVIATTGSDVSMSEKSGVAAQTVVVGGGTGAVTLDGELTSNVEVTGSGRTINLCGMNLESLIISGTNNVILVDENTKIQNLLVQVGGDSNKITINGYAENANIYGKANDLNGKGTANNVIVMGARCSVSVETGKLDNSKVDNGLYGGQIKLNIPNVPAGGAVTATANVTGISGSVVCAAQWYYDGKPDKAYGNSAVNIVNGTVFTYKREIEFTKDMPLSHELTLKLTYKNKVTEEIETVTASGNVKIQNYPDSHYLPSVDEVLAKVQPNFYKKNVDYTDDEKTVFVNAKGYSSDTKYLLWVSRSAQMVNVFSGSKGNWKLIHEFQCATGKSSTPTPIGVTKVTYKQTAWVTDAYTCRPIVRFYPGTGYAFHSRLYYPGTNKLKDASIGFPVSAGCVRMLDEGIYWLYDNIPSGTTVVIY